MIRQKIATDATGAGASADVRDSRFGLELG
jgi:hypothetical protein